MLIRQIKDRVNTRLAGEQLTYSQLLPYLDAVVDDINARLHAKFKIFSEVSTGNLDIEYAEFPDVYIRSVVCVGAAVRWYQDDEEGIATAESLLQEYRNNLFLMERDYGPLVPDEKKAINKSGFLEDHPPFCAHTLNPDIRYVEVPGLPGTSVTNCELRQTADGQHLFIQLTDAQTNIRWVDCGLIAYPIVQMLLDINGNIVAQLSDGTYHVICNLYLLIDQAIRHQNPIVGLRYINSDFVAVYLDGSTKVIGTFPYPTNMNWLFVSASNDAPVNMGEYDIWVKLGDF